MRGISSLAEKATKLAELRDSEGCFSKCTYEANEGLRIEEYHHPMSAIYEVYPNAVRMEVQMMEQLLGTRMARKNIDAGKGRELIIYDISSLGSPAERGVFNGVQAGDSPRAAVNPDKVAHLS